MQVSILNLSRSIDETVALAPHLEQLGYRRFWISEHWPQPSPTMMAAIVAAVTSTIRVGTAAALLHYYAPLVRLAHDFQFLERAFEGRIDAGIGEGIAQHMPEDEWDGRDGPAVLASYADRVARFVRHARNTPGDPAYDRATAWRGALDDPPPLWLHGQSARSAELAAGLGMSYGYEFLYAHSKGDPAVLARYRDTFVPSRTQPEPRAILAVAGICAATKSEAMSRMQALASPSIVPRVVGEPAECADQLRVLAERFAVAEILFGDLVSGIDDRKRCYELLGSALAR